MTKLIRDSKYFISQISSLLLYQSVFENEVGEAYINLLRELSVCTSKIEQEFNNTCHCLQAYGLWFKSLAKIELSWQDYLVKQILLNDNPFSQQIQKKSLDELPISLIQAAKQDLAILQDTYNCSTKTIATWVQNTLVESKNIIVWQADITSEKFFDRQQDWTDTLQKLADYYSHYGTGIFARYGALRWKNKQLIGISNPDRITLSQIFGYESQKQTLIKNTKFLLTGNSALNVLLYGSRGSGKSSLVKALLSEYQDIGLRIIEVNKSQLHELPDIIEKIKDIPQKFIIFVDDLSFEEDNDDFKGLKVVLEGNLTAKPQNIVVYATTNRKHLIREFFGDRPRPRDSDEIHKWDTVQEKLSFSDRFGLTLTFEAADLEKYLIIVNNLAKEYHIDLPQEELEFLAKQWATRGNGRSGRTARQFIDCLRSQKATTN